MNVLVEKSSLFRVGKMKFHHCCPPGKNPSDAHGSW